MEPSQSLATTDHNDHNLDHDDDQELFLSQLPKTRTWLKPGLTQYQGFWLPSFALPNIIKLQKHFRAHDQDILLASKPKSGTTWLKALLFSIVNRARYTPSDTPLLASNPHTLVPFVEFNAIDDPASDVADAPRLFSTHLPYSTLPDSIKTSSCRIVYVCRNPLDVIVSYWHFTNQDHPDRDDRWTMEDYVDSFCKGSDAYGPFCDHVLEFWSESLERPEKVMFLNYEDMKQDTVVHVKRIAEFVGFPFSEEEEKNGGVQQICELCSLDSLKGFETKNKHKPGFLKIKNEFYYRKGEVGDWVNELSPAIVERVEKVIQEKLKGSSLAFKTRPQNYVSEQDC